jgi:hypothetical protein
VRFLSRIKEEPVTVVDSLQADLAEAEERLADLKHEAAGIRNRVVLAALAGDAEEFVAAQMREAALPVLANRAALAVVDAELAVVGERKRGSDEKRQAARTRHEELHANLYLLTRSERREYEKVQFCHERCG